MSPGWSCPAASKVHSASEPVVDPNRPHPARIYDYGRQKACGNNEVPTVPWETAGVTFLVVTGVPFPLEHSGNPPLEAELAGDTLKLTAAAATDLFIDPAADGTPLPDAGRYTGLPADRDFTLSARVSVDF